MPAAKIDLIIEQGATFKKAFIWHAYDENNPPTYKGDPKDLTGYTAKMQVRDDPATETVLLELTSENGGITLGGDSGIVQLNIPAEDTADLEFDNYLYDLLLIYDDVITRLVKGSISVSAGVTRVE